jgi:hypothetical protein
LRNFGSCRIQGVSKAATAATTSRLFPWFKCRAKALLLATGLPQGISSDKTLGRGEAWMISRALSAEIKPRLVLVSSLNSHWRSASLVPLSFHICHVVSVLYSLCLKQLKQMFVTVLQKSSDHRLVQCMWRVARCRRGGLFGGEICVCSCFVLHWVSRELTAISRFINPRRDILVRPSLNVPSGSSSRSYQRSLFELQLALGLVRNFSCSLRSPASSLDGTSVVADVDPNSAVSSGDMKALDLTVNIDELVNQAWEISQTERASLKQEYKKQPRRSPILCVTEGEWLQDVSSDPPTVHPSSHNPHQQKVSAARQISPIKCTTRLDDTIPQAKRAPRRVRPSPTSISPGEPFYDQIAAYHERWAR